MSGMKLTPVEENLVARLRKQEGNEKRFRILFLSTGISQVITAIVIGSVMLNFPSKEPEIVAIIFSFCFPLGLFLFTAGIYQLWRSWWSWNGDPMRALLLKLIDERSNQADREIGGK